MCKYRGGASPCVWRLCPGGYRHDSNVDLIVMRDSDLCLLEDLDRLIEVDESVSEFGINLRMDVMLKSETKF